ncbi:MutS-related protein [Alicyclobacillus sp. ALC3]|uniref:MutS-related protein n=1 Tax=Alicyclobacillus sp. ALC3 TaxID=2796143 RepID=UPI0023798D67|nr:hypothetical protein [Alicyclobacillus sp. ALC3]WDL99783.1 hypothetical protein JC200_23715 [Alicyclobacillus sp. ALC3]
MTFTSVLTPSSGWSAQTTMPEFFTDLNLDQVVDDLTRGREDYNLKPFFYTPATTTDVIHFRQQVMRDVERPPVHAVIADFAEEMQRVRRYQKEMQRLYYPAQEKAWFLEMVQIYCRAALLLAKGLDTVELKSQGLQTYRENLRVYVSSGSFRKLADDVENTNRGLRAIRYCVFIKGDSVTVQPSGSEPDYSVEIEETFAKFRQGEVKDYRVKFSDWMQMSHVDALVVDGLTKLFPNEFAKLEQLNVEHQDFLDEGVVTFDREIQFYMVYINYISRLRNRRLAFCYPVVSDNSKEVSVKEAVDLPLAQKLATDGEPVVPNDFWLRGRERILVVSGPNQGGKTTFARMFGQLHYLASLGCPVPAKEAQLYLFDQIHTHFEREEHAADRNGKLKDDLLRLRDILDQATPRSILIINEIFSSTSLEDGIYLGKRAMDAVMRLDAPCVLVTFIDELASLGEQTVSMTSTVCEDNPAVRTFKVIRHPADGLSYALSIAQKHRLTYTQLKERLSS